MPSPFKRDSAGIRALLLDSMWDAPLRAAVESVAANARAAHPDMEDDAIDAYTTDRRAMSYTVKDPRALLWQVDEGLLTRAAAAVGLEVTDRVRG